LRIDGGGHGPRDRGVRPGGFAGELNLLTASALAELSRDPGRRVLVIAGPSSAG